MSFLSLHDAAGMSEQGWLLMLLLMLQCGWLAGFVLRNTSCHG